MPQGPQVRSMAAEGRSKTRGERLCVDSIAHTWAFPPGSLIAGTEAQGSCLFEDFFFQVKIEICIFLKVFRYR